MLRYKTIPVTTGSLGEQKTNALAGIGERKRIIREIKCENVRVNPAVANAIDQIRVVGYKNQDQVLDAHLGSFTTGYASGTTLLFSEGLFKLDLPLDQGDGFQVGCYFGATIDYPRITMVYEDQ